MASGVAYLHNCVPVVVHGDLKGVRFLPLFFRRTFPELGIQCNILINSDERAVITDFGLAKVKEELSDATDRPASSFAGSTRWMAPELLMGQLGEEQKVPVTTYSDTYAFASVCLEVARGPTCYS